MYRALLRYVHGIVHDHLSAPVAHHLSSVELERWLEQAGGQEPVLRHHNAMSWLVAGRLPRRPLESRRDPETGSSTSERDRPRTERRL